VTALPPHRATPLDDVIQALPHGVCVYDRERRVAAFNAAYARIMAGAPVTLGETLEDIVRRRAEAGEYGPGDIADHVRHFAAAHGGAAVVRRRVRPNGVAIEIRTAPLPDGGMISVVTDITDLHRAEREARERARVLDLMLESMRHGITLFGPDRRVIAANRLAEELSEASPGTVTPGRSFDELVAGQLANRPDGNTERLRRAAAEALAQDRSKPSRMVRPNASGRMLEVFSDPTPDGGFVVTHVDITPLAHARAEAQQRAATLETMLEGMRHGIALFDAEHRLVASNRLAARLIGLPAEALRPGRHFAELVRAQQALGEHDAARAEHHIAADRSKPSHYARTRRDGTVIEVDSDPVPGGGFVVSITDITARVSAEREAQHRAEVLAVMLDNMRHGICLFDAEGRVVAANALAARMVGLAPEEMAPGTSIDEIRLKQFDRGEFGRSAEAEAAAQARLAAPWNAEERYERERGDDTRLEVTTTPTPSGGFVRVYRDITEERRIRVELERARAAAEAASQAKSRFLATMSHELRTPLNAIIGFSEALIASPSGPDSQEFIGAVRDAGRHLLGLIDDILDVARAGSAGFRVNPVPVDPVALAAEIGRVMGSALAEAGLRLALEIAPGLPLVQADERRLRQILLNLMSNAVKFTPAGGRVTLALGLSGAAALEFQVTDTGVGMRPEDIPAAFEPFTQLDSTLARRYQGAGLGLHLSRVLAEAMGGRLDLASAPGAGSTATLTLPAYLLRPRNEVTETP